MPNNGYVFKHIEKNINWPASYEKKLRIHCIKIKEVYRWTYNFKASLDTDQKKKDLMLEIKDYEQNNHSDFGFEQHEFCWELTCGSQSKLHYSN